MRFRMGPVVRTAPVAAALLLTAPVHAAAQAVGDHVEVNGMRMYYEVSGAGDPLVVLHGAYMNIPSMGGTPWARPSGCSSPSRIRKR